MKCPVRNAAYGRSDAFVLPSRIELLKGFIARRPSDPFPQYGLALEYKNAGLLAEARSAFEALMEQHPTYTAAYLHAGNTALALGRMDEARAIYARGLEACAKAGDTHARGELEGALAALPTSVA
jgi:tetratricopeptide (TPR) repeat protein